MKPVDSKTVTEINARVDGWSSRMFSNSHKLAIREFLANEKGMTFFESIVSFGPKEKENVQDW